MWDWTLQSVSICRYIYTYNCTAIPEFRVELKRSWRDVGSGLFAFNLFFEGPWRGLVPLDIPIDHIESMNFSIPEFYRVLNQMS